ncbi:hypothetical protein QQ045_011076 [Rhodiola kirilowii]
MAESQQVTSKSCSSETWARLKKVRAESPLIQCITNFVSMDLMANVLLSAGASPAMLHSVTEIPDFTPVVQAVCVNVGTLTDDWLPSMIAAAKIATKMGKPWVLDPVAAGASEFRLRACLELVEMRPSVIRGNASEIVALSEAAVGRCKLIEPCEFILVKGTDSSLQSTDALEVAKALANSSGAVVAVSGAIDIVTDGTRVLGAKNGVPMLQRITATGCSVTALIAAFVAVDPQNTLEATASALAVFGVASELGMEMAKGPASLRMHLIDSLYNLDEVNVLNRVKISSLP